MIYDLRFMIGASVRPSKAGMNGLNLAWTGKIGQAEQIAFRGRVRQIATALWSACDLSPLWFVAERRRDREVSVGRYGRHSKFGQRGSAAFQSGDKSHALHTQALRENPRSFVRSHAPMPPSMTA